MKLPNSTGAGFLNDQHYYWTRQVLIFSICCRGISVHLNLYCFRKKNRPTRTLRLWTGGNLSKSRRRRIWDFRDVNVWNKVWSFFGFWLFQPLSRVKNGRLQNPTKKHTEKYSQDKLSKRPWKNAKTIKKTLIEKHCRLPCFGCFGEGVISAVIHPMESWIVTYLHYSVW